MRTWIGSTVALLALAGLAGCEKSLDEERQDVVEAQQEAAENVAEEQRDVEEARQEGARDIAEEQREAHEEAAEHAVPPATPEETPLPSTP
jgi:hypothetical protein